MIANSALPLRMQQPMSRHTKQNLYDRFIHLSLHFCFSIDKLYFDNKAATATFFISQDNCVSCQDSQDQFNF